MDANTWIALGALALTVLAAIGGTIRYLQGQIEKTATALRADADTRAAERRGAIAELHRRVDEVKSEAAAFREHVPQHYATISYLKDVETRFNDRLREAEGRITASLGAAEGRLTEHFRRIEERLDRRGPSAGE